jgi:hypothetical protein
MVFGDSFTANSESYVAELRKNFPQYTFLNHAVPGTGVYEAGLMAKRRLKERPFQVVVYQIFVGNDLINVRKTINWQQNSIPRNLYYLLSKEIKSVEYLNFQLRKWRFADKTPSLFTSASFDSLQENPVFSPEEYSPFERRMLGADSSMLEDCVLLKNGREEDFAIFMRQIDAFLEEIPHPEAEIFFLVIPHSTQVSEKYRNNFREMGISFPPDSLYATINYPFIRALQSHDVGNKKVHILNVLPDLREKEAQGYPTYYANDFHINATGQAIMAEVLGREIQKIKP